MVSLYVRAAQLSPEIVDTTRPRSFRWSRVTAVTILIAAVSSFLIRVWRLRHDLLDDAYITFRFAQNLAEGYGLVWNPGGEHVEGFTSMLHVLLMAGAIRLGIPAPTADVVLLTAAVLGTVCVLIAVLRKHEGREWILGSILLSIWIADPNTSSLTTAGLETQMFVLCLAGAYAAAISFMRTPARSSASVLALCVFLSIVCRPDGVIYGAAVFAVLILHVLSSREQGRAAAVLLQHSVCGLLAAGVAYAAIKYSYFGYLLPNPFYVKSNRASLNGAGYVFRYLRHIGLWLGPTALAAILAAPSLLQTRRLRIVAVALTPAILALGYYVTITHEVGGFHRFSYPTYFYFVMSVCVLSTTALELTVPVQGRVLITVACISAVLMMADSARSAGQAESGLSFNDAHFRIAEALRSTGLGPRASVACDGAGIIPYVSKFRQIDRVGLTNNYLSGRKPITAEQREAYVWGERPDVYIGYEPPAPAGGQGIKDDEQAYPSYVRRLITHKRVTIEDRTFAGDPAVLDQRMARLRDEWICVGAVDWPGWKLWGLKYLVYVRKDSQFSDVLVQKLSGAVGEPWGSSSLLHSLQ